MTTFFIGLVDEVRPQQRKNKDTGVVTMFLQVTATFETKDKEGYLVKATQDIQMDMADMTVLSNAKGKYLLIPYMYISSKNGNYLFPNDTLGFQIFDKNPLELKKTA